MSYPWFPMHTKWALVQRDVRRTDGRPASYAEAGQEIMALAFDGMLGTMPFSKLATSLGWSRGRLRRFLESFPIDLSEQGADIDLPGWLSGKKQQTRAHKLIVDIPRTEDEHEADTKRTEDGPTTRVLLTEKEEELPSMSDESATEGRQAKLLGGFEPEPAPKDPMHGKPEGWHVTQRLLKLRATMMGTKAAMTAAEKVPAKSHRDLVKKLIGDGHTEDDLSWLIRWAFLAPAERDYGGPDFLRGDKTGTAYLKPPNLLTLEKAPGRIERALAWREAGCPTAGKFADNADEPVVAICGRKPKAEPEKPKAVPKFPTFGAPA